ncbi:hypothetical protein TI05_17330, partial [Achromatium sp. WMS3]
MLVPKRAGMTLVGNQSKSVFFLGLIDKLIKKDPDDPDIMDALLAENQKLFNQMSDLLEKQLKEGSGLIRRGQILRLLTDRTVCDQPMVSLM